MANLFPTESGAAGEEFLYDQLKVKQLIYNTCICIQKSTYEIGLAGCCLVVMLFKAPAATLQQFTPEQF